MKKTESYEQLTALMNDEDLQQLVAAWPTLAPVEGWKVTMQGSTDQSQTGVWMPYFESDWIDMMSKMIGMHPNRFGKTLSKAITFRLIHPDGTIHQNANAYLRGLIVRSLSPASRRTTKPLS